MSRSRKKRPWWKMISDSYYKGLANRRVRRDKQFDVDGKAYKKLSCSYDICDWKYYEGKAPSNDPVWRK